jgi:hypothetical protein
MATAAEGRLAMTEYHPDYVIGPFKFLVEVKFPDPITKLDFVNNRYQVKGKKQILAQVLDDGSRDPPRTDGQVYDATQWLKPGKGLDLRGRKDFSLSGTAEADILFPPLQARLKNRETVPTKANPGALNEFTFLDYTIVLEFDWFDRKPVMEDRAGYNDVDHAWDKIETFFISKADSPGIFVDPAKNLCHSAIPD